MKRPNPKAARQPNRRPNSAPSRSPSQPSGSLKNLPHPSNHLIIGRNSLSEVLKHTPERILLVYVAARGAEVGDRRNRDLIDALQHRRIELREVQPAALADLCGSEAHQSFVAFLKERQPLDLAKLVAAAQDREFFTVVALDSVFDPHNIGAIMRATECLGADAVLWSKNRGGEITAAVSKASAGASELIRQVSVSNLVESLRKLKDAGFWIVGAQSSPAAVELATFDWPKKSVIVLGSEGMGLHRLVSETCDFSVKIPLLGKIESLNVSQAAAILLYSRVGSLGST